MDIRKLQARLNELGFDAGKVDGIRGPKTDRAVIAFKRSVGLAPRPFVGPLTWAALFDGEKLEPTDEFPWIEEIMTVYGLHETRDNAALQIYLRSDGMTLGDPARFPWCGDLIETAIKNSLPDEPIPMGLARNPYWARNWALFGVPCDPVRGAIATFERPGGGGHVGVLTAQTATTFVVLGGNQSNSVNELEIAKNRLLSTRWPATWPNPRIVLTTVKAGTHTLSRNEA